MPDLAPRTAIPRAALGSINALLVTSTLWKEL